MLDSLKLSMRKGQCGAGIYDAGDTEKCYTKLFVTDSGRVLPINYRVISEDDLLEAYRWGREDAFIELGKLPYPMSDEEWNEISMEEVLGVCSTGQTDSLDDV